MIGVTRSGRPGNVGKIDDHMVELLVPQQVGQEVQFLSEFYPLDEVEFFKGSITIEAVISEEPPSDLGAVVSEGPSFDPIALLMEEPYARTEGDQIHQPAAGHRPESAPGTRSYRAYRVTTYRTSRTQGGE